MEKSIEMLWKLYLKDDPDLKGAKLRLASRAKLAKPWVTGVASPQGTTTMLSNVEIHKGWTNPHALNIARKTIESNPKFTLRELSHSMLSQVQQKVTSYPYVWWIYESSSPKRRAVHEDATGVTFIKLDGKWQLVYPCQALGVLVGRQGAGYYENIPRNAYFVLCENEAAARKH